MLRRLRSPVGLFLLLCVVAMLSFVASVMSGRLSEFMDGIAVEMFGAIVTAGGVVGLEEILTYRERQKQKQEIADLRQRLDQQSRQLESILSHLQHQNNAETGRVSTSQQ
ncbi:MAG: hypothetical protein SF123_12950 [Chloroflexota bacterium]|nr:hypothetical protein [Chloroflexota bacterium]